MLKCDQALLSAYQILHLNTAHPRTWLLSPLCLSQNKAFPFPDFLRQMQLFLQAANKGQEYLLCFAFKIRKVKAWYNGKKRNAGIYFFVASVFPNCNYFFTLPYSPTYFFGLFSSLHLRSAELAHLLLSLETLNSEVSIKPTAQKFPVIYCHCENNIFLI